MTGTELASMSARRFFAYVTGLSEKARWPRAWAATPLVTSSPADIAAALGAYYGPPADPPPGGDPPEQ